MKQPSPRRALRALRRNVTLASLAMALPVVIAASPAPRPDAATPRIPVLNDAVAAPAEYAVLKSRIHPAPKARKHAAGRAGGKAAGGDRSAARADRRAAADAPRRLATVGEVTLYSPAPHALAHGFHEGSSESLALAPRGRAVANPRGVDLPGTDAHGVDYVVMPSRGRSAAAASAVDVAVEHGRPIVSPVEGTVLDVSQYSLYGRTSDLMIRIRPARDPSLCVVLFHVEDVEVAAGDRVEAGRTVVAGSGRQLPFGSQVDRFSGAATPHVHVQVEPC